MNTNGSHNVDAFSKLNITETNEDIFERFMHQQKHDLLLYRALACTIGSMLIASNLIVVVSSGLILRKAGSKCKSTFLLLGNVSLADTLVGINIIFVNIRSHNVYSDSMCIFLIGLIVTPTLVSVISVGLIAVDRYIYILHGMYYHTWINSYRVRISIMFTWLLGIALGFMPATGWAEDSMGGRKCWYLAVAPPGLVTLIAVIGFLPVSLVWILYSIVLYRALKKVEQLQTADNKAELRMNRGKVGNREQADNKEKVDIRVKVDNREQADNREKGDIPDKVDVQEKVDIREKVDKREKFDSQENVDNREKVHNREVDIRDKVENRGEYPKNVINSISASIETGLHVGCNVRVVDSKHLKNTIKKRKNMEPSKWRAIKVVMLTTGSLICTWVPYFIATIMYVLCDKKTDEERCLTIEQALTRPLANLALLNSLFNPLIYAWWHKGFNAAVRKIFREFRIKFTRFIKSSKSCVNS